MAESSDDYNAKVIAEFRANSGRVGGTWEETPLLLLHHTGAMSGVSRVNPVAYLPDMDATSYGPRTEEHRKIQPCIST